MADINDYPNLLAACEAYVIADRKADALLGSPVQNVDDSLALAGACAARHVAHMALEQLTIRLLTNAGRWAGETPAADAQPAPAAPAPQRPLQDACAAVLTCVIAFVLADREADRCDIDVELGSVGLAEYNDAMQRRDDALRTLREQAEQLLPELAEGAD